MAFTIVTNGWQPDSQLIESSAAAVRNIFRESHIGWRGFPRDEVLRSDSCLYRYDEYSEGILLCTTRIGEKMGAFPVHYLLVDAKGKTARIIVRGRRSS